MQAGDPLPPRLYVVLSGVLQITRVSQTGKETVFRVLPAGEIFAAPALVGGAGRAWDGEGLLKRSPKTHASANPESDKRQDGA
ncbi:cyclic nucleotide-binding domain-containing protein [Leptolyngbya sp. 7M]|uniref:cyclic nucleotide-binding domain-containing protein n=1 Tax=Leptolyngbya sp. 7M TaxID=2812896 RepID=UPI0039774898